MNKDQIKGRIDQATGKIKEEAGDLVDNKRMENEGKADKSGGKAQADQRADPHARALVACIG